MQPDGCKISDQLLLQKPAPSGTQLQTPATAHHGTAAARSWSPRALCQQPPPPALDVTASPTPPS